MSDTTPTINEKIETMVSSWFHEPVIAVEDEIKQLLADFAEHITPEKRKKLTKATTNDFHSVDYWLGYWDAIDTITKRTKEVLK